MEEDSSSSVVDDPEQRGYDWEREFFGVSTNDFQYPAYLEWQKAVLNAIIRQKEVSWNPKRPSTHVSRELFDCVKAFLPKELGDELEFFCSLGSAFDVFHGVDGFFMINRFLVTIDLKVGKSKQKKADFILRKKQSGSELWRLAKCIADKFIEAQLDF